MQTIASKRECQFHGCHAEGDIKSGVVRLCVVHFLRNRVRINLRRLAA